MGSRFISVFCCLSFAAASLLQTYITGLQTYISGSPYADFMPVTVPEASDGCLMLFAKDLDIPQAEPADTEQAAGGTTVTRFFARWVDR